MSTISFRLSRTKAFLLLIFALTSLVYAGSLKNGFVLDDSVLIVQNDFIKSWENFPKIFGKEYLTAIGNWSNHQKLSGSGEVTYRPLVTMTYFLDYHLWKLNPFGHHLTNLGLHLLSVLLMFFLVRALSRKDSVALLASLLFAVHPVNSEAVLVITNRKDMMTFLLYASAFLFFLKKDASGERKGMLFSSLSLLCFFLALFTKEMAVTLPATLMLYDLFFVFRGDWKALRARALKRYGGYFLVLFSYGVFWFLLRGGVGDFHKAYPYPGGSLYTNLCTMTRVVAVYIQWLFLPFHLRATFVGPGSFPPSHSLFEPSVLCAAALILSFLGAAFAFRKRSPALSFTVFWFFLSLVPVLNLVPLPIIIACRYLYIPSAIFSLGLALALASISRYQNRFISAVFSKSVVLFFIALLVTAYCFATLSRVPVWNDNFSLSQEHAANYPGAPVVHINLAGEFRNQGRWGDALRECKVAISLAPKIPDGYNDLGVTLLGAGHPEQAIEYLHKALVVRPDFLPAYCNLGLGYAAMGQWTESRRAWQEALRLAPHHEGIKAALKEVENH